MKAALYDLGKELISYDFITWAVNVRELGYDHISFGTKVPAWGRKGMEPARLLQRLYNFMIPATQMLGMGYDERGQGARGVGSSHYYHMPPNFKRLESPQKKDVAHTVTIRQVNYFKQHRNSNRTVWCAFADKIKAHVIDEFDCQPISFQERMAYYAGAKMNWGVTNGPVSTLFLTPYPVTIFCDPKLDTKGFSGHHILPGGQLPFSLPHQNLVWGDITLDNLMAQYELLMDGGHPSVGAMVCRCSLAGDFAGAWQSGGAR